MFSKQFTILQILITAIVLFALYSLFNFGNGYYKEMRQLKNQNKELINSNKDLTLILSDSKDSLSVLKQNNESIRIDKQNALKTSYYYKNKYLNEKSKIHYLSIDVVYDSIVAISNR